MPSNTKRGPGRPRMYPTTGRQNQSIRRMFTAGKTFAQIQDKLGVHEYAVLRVRRQMRAEGLV
jgi:hypothetical protein